MRGLLLQSGPSNKLSGDSAKTPSNRHKQRNHKVMARLLYNIIQIIKRNRNCPKKNIILYVNALKSYFMDYKSHQNTQTEDHRRIYKIQTLCKMDKVMLI